MPVNLRTSQNGFLRDGPKRVLRDYMDPHFFLSSFLISYEKNEKESEKKVILVTFLPENIRSSGDDNLSSGGVLIWFSLFITHNYKLLYYTVIFFV